MLASFSDIPVLGSKVISEVYPTELTKLNISILLVVLSLIPPNLHSNNQSFLLSDRAKALVLVPPFYFYAPCLPSTNDSHNTRLSPISR